MDMHIPLFQNKEKKDKRQELFRLFSKKSLQNIVFNECQVIFQISRKNGYLINFMVNNYLN